jgi:hypothetical protein
LPHAHILLILDEVLKLRTAEDYDLMVLAKILDLICHLEAYEMITSCMVHGPCGPNFLNAQCMEQGKCKKGTCVPLAKKHTVMLTGTPSTSPVKPTFL